VRLRLDNENKKQIVKQFGKNLIRLRVYIYQNLYFSDKAFLVCHPKRSEGWLGEGTPTMSESTISPSYPTPLIVIVSTRLCAGVLNEVVS
jgi:hypothetical protein